jgi:hypothetical protein
MAWLKRNVGLQQRRLRFGSFALGPCLHHFCGGAQTALQSALSQGLAFTQISDVVARDG